MGTGDKGTGSRRGGAEGRVDQPHHLAPKLKKEKSYMSVLPRIAFSLSLSLSVFSCFVIWRNLPFPINFLETHHSLHHHRNCWVANPPYVKHLIRAELISSICDTQYRFVFKKINNFMDISSLFKNAYDKNHKVSFVHQ